MKRLYLLFALSLCMAFRPDPAYTQSEVHPTASDIVSLVRVGHPRLAADGESILYTLTTTTYSEGTPEAGAADNPSGWKTETQVYRAALSGGHPRQYTNAKDSYSPEWSPDMKWIAFLRTEGGKTKIHIIATGPGEARSIDTGELEPSSITWSADGKFFLFTAPPVESREEKEANRRTGGVEEIDHAWASSQLWSVVLDGGSPHRITRGEEHVVKYALSPDGKNVALILTASSDPYLVYNLRSCQVIALDSGTVIDSVESAPALIENISWSRDSKFLAYETTKQSLSLLNTLRVHELASKATWDVTTSLDLTLDSFVWGGDSRSLIVHVNDKTTSRLYRVPSRGGTFADCGFSGRVIGSEIESDRSGHRLLFLSSTHRDPPDLTVYDLRTNAWRVIGRANPQVEQWVPSLQELIHWKNKEGIEIEGLLATPDPTPREPGQLIVLPHGGPDAATSQGFSSWVRFFVARGYSVFRPNYRGSLGYGYEFYASNRGRLGEVELADCESGVDHLIAERKAAPDRLVYGGWSWGGYTTAWAIGHTNRYRAAVVGAGVIDVASAYATSDINHGIAAQWEYKGDPWRQTEHFDRSSPSRFLKNAITPTLIIHGRSDTRVSFTQGLTLYRALKDVGCETKFFAYPRENHGFREPAHTVHFLNAWVDWYRDHLVPKRGG